MRGKVYFENKYRHVKRITPAYAGKSPTHDENISGWGGSPPPMRGKVFNQIDQKQLSGITPAYAGKRNITV